MGSKNKNVKLSLVEEYVKKSLALQKSDGYYGILEGCMIFLGKTTEDASENLEAIIDDGKQLAPLPKKEEEKQIEPSDQITETSLQAVLEKVQQTETDDDVKAAIQEALGKVVDLKPVSRRGNFVVYVDGIEADRWLDRKVPDTHLVKTIPFTFYWLEQDYNVEDGTLIVNDNWTVLDKSLAKRMKITVHRDDTPGLPFFTVKKKVLCIARKDQYKRKKAIERLKGNIALPKMLHVRKELAKQAASLSKTNTSAAAQIFANDAQATMMQQAKTLHEQSGLRLSVEDAQKMLDKVSEGNLDQIMDQIDEAYKTGNIISDSDI